MLSLELDLAIYQLLTGYPLDDQGRPVLDVAGVPTNRLRFGPPFSQRYAPLDGTTGTAALANRWPSYGVRIPMTSNGLSLKKFASRNDPAIRIFGAGFQQNAFRQVPVFDENIEGRDFKNIWPCVTFRQTDEDPNFDQYVYSDDFKAQVGLPVNIVNKQGTIIESGTTQLQRRQHPDAYDVSYMIRTYSKNRIENGLIVDAIKYLMPQRFGIELMLADGTSHVCDAEMTGIINLDSAGNEIAMNSDGDEQRYYSRGFIYKIEAFSDNSVNAFGTNDIYADNVILQRILDLEDMQSNLFSMTEQNASELQPIPGKTVDEL